MSSRNYCALLFRGLLEDVDPAWTSRSQEERQELVSWFTRTAIGISRQYYLRDPVHDSADLLQEFLLKIFTKFGNADAPHRLLTEKPCMRKLMEWRAMDRVDWENAERRSAKRRASFPDEEVGMPDRGSPAPDRSAELLDEERGFRRTLRRPEERKAYLLFRAGLPDQEVARMLRRPRREITRLRERLIGLLAQRLLT